jgi:hypothetical protein
LFILDFDHQAAADSWLYGRRKVGKEFNYYRAILEMWCARAAGHRAFTAPPLADPLTGMRPCRRVLDRLHLDVVLLPAEKFPHLSGYPCHFGLAHDPFFEAE